MYNGTDDSRKGEISLYSTVVNGIKVKQIATAGETCEYKAFPW